MAYFVAFTIISSKNSDEDGLLFGFCVWGNQETAPNKKDGCSGSSSNSHIIAFAIDFIMALIVGYLYLQDKGSVVAPGSKRQEGKEGEATKKQPALYMAFAFIILMHGALYFLIDSSFINCYRHITPGSGLEDLGYIIFGLFSFFLCLIILGVGFDLSRHALLIWSGIFTALIIFITRTAGNTQYILPGLFCVAHPLSSFVGYFTKKASSVFSSRVGWIFVISTFVGILELTTCPMFFKAIGGHFYYDLTLHTSVIYALPYFTNNKSKIDDHVVNKEGTGLER